MWNLENRFTGWHDVDLEAERHLFLDEPPTKTKGPS